MQTPEFQNSLIILGRPVYVPVISVNCPFQFLSASVGLRRFADCLITRPIFINNIIIVIISIIIT